VHWVRKGGVSTMDSCRTCSAAWNRINFDSSSRVRVFGPDGVVCTTDGFSIFGVVNVCKGEE